MKRKTIIKQGRRVALAACTLLIGASVLHSCKDEDHEVLTGQPGWLGNSIYERLKEDPDGQKYSTLLRLIDELGQKDVLSQTGSKTIFAADDAAFDRWFKTNKWGARSYEALTKAQKTMLLNTAMVNNMNASFLKFYQEFATDSAFQMKSLSNPISFVGPDPDDDFNTLKGDLLPEQWDVVGPTDLPNGLIYNIIYGQKYTESSQKVFLLRGIANGQELEMTFQKKDDEWKLVKLVE
jgi:hypothetical protein